jgi:deazaflavin-dependent oxidoreductase (nitroreductase family)
MEPSTLARLKRVAGKKTTILTHYGRKTGKAHEVTIWFVLDDDKLYLGTANVNRQWVRNVQKTPKIRLSIGGETFEGNARFLTDRAEHERARRLFDGSTGCFDRSLRWGGFSPQWG